MVGKIQYTLIKDNLAEIQKQYALVRTENLEGRKWDYNWKLHSSMLRFENERVRGSWGFASWYKSDERLVG